MIFPIFGNIDLINNIREEYDPLYNHVAPHITLVFPFLSELATGDLREHVVDALRDFTEFNLQLKLTFFYLKIHFFHILLKKLFF